AVEAKGGELVGDAFFRVGHRRPDLLAQALERAMLIAGQAREVRVDGLRTARHVGLRLALHELSFPTARSTPAPSLWLCVKPSHRSAAIVSLARDHNTEARRHPPLA